MNDQQAQLIAQLKSKRIVVLGAGLSGMSCVRFLYGHDIYCSVNDSRSKAVKSEDFNVLFPKCQLRQGQWQHQMIADAEIILLSPGIDLEAENLVEYISADCQVIGDVELFCQLSDLPILAVTGSNGKSTVVSLLAHIGNALGYKTLLGGNIGTPVLEQLNSSADMLVLELSSFQLETLTSMRAVAATILNISDDHLDRHKTLENYCAIKQRIYQQCQTVVTNRDDKLTQLQADKKIKQCSFGSDAPEIGQFGIAVHQGEKWLMFGLEPLIAVERLPLAGQHNALNCLAVLALGHIAGWSLKDMASKIASFEGLPHRCQRIQSNDGLYWINDSKATNVGAALAAISGLASDSREQHILLIAGGDGKGADFAPLASEISRHVHRVFTFGKDGGKIASLVTNAQQVPTLEAAVKEANKCARAGDIILLSPACASIDMFQNFAERGRVFADTVRSLQEAC